MSDTPEKTLFKDFINPGVVERITKAILTAYPKFDSKSFQKAILPQIPKLELKDRIILIAQQLRDHLPPDYPEALQIVLQALSSQLDPEPRHSGSSFAFWPYGTFIEHYGLEHFEESMQAIYHATQRFTMEFAIRPYILQNQNRALEILNTWVKDKNEHVRRLVSEGTRPYLPWGSNLPAIIQEPKPVLALLEFLKNDPYLYVRRSVANNLNGISKDHPETVIKILNRWQKGATKETQWLIRHALRTLLKQGNPEALALLGYQVPEVELISLEVSPKKINMGESLQITASLKSKLSIDQALMIDYQVFFKKSNGSLKPKVFKWKTVKLSANETLEIQKKHTIKEITTRAYYPGIQRVELLVNGKSVGKENFELGAW